MLDRALTFGRYRIEPQGGLMSGDREMRLTPKALALLTFLAERPARSSAKRSCSRRFGRTSTVGDAALVTCIQELRKALRDNARRPRYIETLHRRGYRFIAEKSRRHRPTAAAPAAPALPLPDRPSIAVLPFTNMSGDPEQELLCRRHLGRSDHRALPHPLAVRDRPQLDIRLQTPSGGREAGLARAWRPLRARRQRAPRREQAAHQRAAHRCDERRPSLGRTL